MPEIGIKEKIIRKTKKKTVTFPETMREGQVTVHCNILGSDEAMYIRIWESTFLLDNGSEHSSQLQFAFNVSMYPHWTAIPLGKNYKFTLIFSPLPKTCTSFDLQEIIPEQGGLHITNIVRNKSDVYVIDIL